MSTDPAMGEYVPSAPVNEDVKKRNGNLPGMGGVFNTVNMHVYHYAGNNPVVYIDPDGKAFFILPVVVAILKVAAVSAAVAGSADIVLRQGPKIVKSAFAGEGLNYDPNQTWSAMAGGFVSGGLAATPVGATVSGAVGNATSTAVDNLFNGRPISEGVVDSLAPGALAGTLSNFAPPLPGGSAILQDTSTSKSMVREGVRGAANAARDEGFSIGSNELIQGVNKLWEKTKQIGE